MYPLSSPLRSISVAAIVLSATLGVLGTPVSSLAQSAAHVTLPNQSRAAPERDYPLQVRCDGVRLEYCLRDCGNKFNEDISAHGEERLAACEQNCHRHQCD